MINIGKTVAMSYRKM